MLENCFCLNLHQKGIEPNMGILLSTSVGMTVMAGTLNFPQGDTLPCIHNFQGGVELLNLIDYGLLKGYTDPEVKGSVGQSSHVPRERIKGGVTLPRTDQDRYVHFVPTDFLHEIFLRQNAHKNVKPRSEERRVGKECRSRWSPY